MALHQLDIDPGHSTIEFAVTYATNSVIKGRFLDFSGSISLDSDRPEDSEISVSINAASLTTDNEPRDEHLKGADFFDVESNAEITFESTAIDVTGENHWTVTGDLAIVGRERQIALDTHYYGIVEDALGNTRAGFVSSVDIQRSDWGLSWNQEQEAGVLVSDRVRISLYISAVPAEPADEEEDEEPDVQDDTEAGGSNEG